MVKSHGMLKALEKRLERQILQPETHGHKARVFRFCAIYTGWTTRETLRSRSPICWVPHGVVQTLQIEQLVVPARLHDRPRSST
jgi:hypothetical protein